MKKTLTLLLAFVAFAAFAAPGGASAGKPTAEPTDSNKINLNAQMGDPIEMGDIQQAPAGLQAIMVERLAQKLKATPNFPATTVDDLVGGYDFVYRQYTGGFTTQPDTISNNYTFQRDTVDNIDVVGINKVADDSVRITGMFLFPVGAKMGTSGNYTTLTLDDTHPVYYHSTYGACNLRGVWYYEGDETYSAGWYIGDVMGYLLEQGILFDPDVHFYMVIASGSYAGYRLGWIYEPSSYMVPDADYNGLMTFNYTSSAASNAGLTPTYDYPVILTEDENYVVTVENFAGVATNPVNITLAEDQTWTAESTVLYTSGSNNFTLYGLDGNTPIDLIGTGTEKVLTFGSEWTGWDRGTGYWIGRRSATTITRLDDDVFVYPTPQPEHAYYLIGAFNSWDQNNMVPFVEEDGVFTLTYNFGGEFKVKDENGAWWGGGVTLTEENPSVTLIDGGNLNLDQTAEYTLTIEDGVLTVSGFPAPQVVEYNDFFVCGTFNGWSQEEGLVELVANEDGTEFAGTVELEAGAEFKLITHNLAGGWKWFGGESNGSGYFLITSELLDDYISLVDGSNFRVEEGGSYDITVMELESKGLQEPLAMVVSKTPTAISTIATDVKNDNAYYNLMGVKFNSMPTAPGIYIHNGKKVIVK